MTSSGLTSCEWQWPQHGMLGEWRRLSTCGMYAYIPAVVWLLHPLPHWGLWTAHLWDWSPYKSIAAVLKGRKHLQKQCQTEYGKGGFMLGLYVERYTKFVKTSDSILTIFLKSSWSVSGSAKISKNACRNQNSVIVSVWCSIPICRIVQI